MHQSLLTTSRRQLLLAGAGVAATGVLVGGLGGSGGPSRTGRPAPSIVTARDGTGLFVKSWGTGPAVVFSHGWPLSADAWDGQMTALAAAGYRVIAHDRRGHGRSDQVWSGNDMDHYADDLADVLAALDVHEATLVGHSTGGGEVARYIGRHGVSRVARAVLISAIPPVMLRSAANPGGTPIEVFEAIRKGVLENRTEYYRELTTPFFGYNRPGVEALPGAREEFWRQAMMGSAKAQFDCIRQFSETDFTEDLRRMTRPTLIIHGDDDQLVPVADAAALSARIAPRATLKIYRGAPHGLPVTHRDRLNGDLLSFLRS